MINENKAYFFVRSSKIDNSFQGIKLLSNDFYNKIIKHKSNEQQFRVLFCVKDHPSRDSLYSIEFARLFAGECIRWLSSIDINFQNTIKDIYVGSARSAQALGLDKNLYTLGILIAGTLEKSQTELFKVAVSEFIWLVNQIESSHSCIQIENRLRVDDWIQKQITG